MQIAFVLWSGKLGGAETFSSDLAAEMRKRGVDARIVFVQGQDPLAERLEGLSVPAATLGFPRGRTVIRRPRRYARAVGSNGSDAAILMERGYLATALRLGGYTGRIVAVEHGTMLLDPKLPWLTRKRQAWNRSLGARAADVEVGVSKFMATEMQRRSGARSVRQIPYGIAVERYRPTRPLNGEGPLRVGWAGRMIPGKGADHLLDAAGLLKESRHIVQMQIAGDGPQRSELIRRSARMGLGDRVRFVGQVHDMPAFWNSCDLAVASSAEFIESFGLTPLEAAACGRPAIVSRQGGLVETVTPETGSVVAPADSRVLAAAIARYAADQDLLQRQGRAARDRAVREFSLARCASDYLAAVAD
jgi:glycosyltransferase involved in cell wall biosynthesis